MAPAAEAKAAAETSAYVGHIVRGLLLLLATHNAYHIRMYAIRTYGNVIHEFDPWFNYRATEYLSIHGLAKFFTWFDYKAWYPLGRPVGTTIYPGMQMSSVAIWRVLNEVLGISMSLNDVCVYVPVWFGVSATALLALLTYECSRSVNAATAAALVMSVVPAHLMRSVGGGYDNESVAMTAMCLTFWLWCRSLRTEASWPLGALTGLAYVNMVAAWGGFVFVLNMIGAHAALLILLGRYRPSLHKAYSLWYVIGTLGATRVPVVGMAPLRSLEQLAPGLLFIGMQLIAVTEYLRQRRASCTRVEAWKLRAQVFGAAGVVFLILCSVLFSTGYFGPISSRVRGLFVKHTRTGNPLVDSVAEHQPASSNAYWHYLHYTIYAAPCGLAVLVLQGLSDAKCFIVLYAVTAYFFSSKMVRLIIFLGPVVSALSGVALGFCVEVTAPLLLEALLGVAGSKPEKEAKTDDDEFDAPTTKKGKKGVSRVLSKPPSAKAVKPVANADISLESLLEDAKAHALETLQPVLKIVGSPKLKVPRTIMAAALLAAGVHYYKQFSDYSWSLAEGMSQPSIMFRAHLRDGSPVMVDDYREAYWWLRDNSPEDARVMAWWDYGYQISGIANRTTIADGNTWNHEHIATLGRCLTSPEKQAHAIARHLADYVLVWTGGGGDDLAKSPHMARIGNSVFRDICPGDPTCSRFGFLDRHGTPTPMMEASLLYKLHSHNQRPGVFIDPTLFREVHTSKFNKVRIFKVLKVSKKSKKWVADPANRICDAPGSWYCRGQYPPALQPLIEQRQNFAQLEDFNKKRDAEANQYTEEYMSQMSGGSSGKKQGSNLLSSKAEEPASYFEVAAEDDDEDEDEDDFFDDDLDDEEELDSQTQESIAQSAAHAERVAQARAEEWAEWADSDDTTRMWAIVSAGRTDDLAAWIKYAPAVVHMRAGDGRGPLWWAFENEQIDLIDLLIRSGANPDATDSYGMTPKQMAASNA